MAIDSSGFWKRLQEVFEGANAPEIARITDRTKQSVYRWRDGQMPDLDVLVDIAESRRVSLHWLVTGQGPVHLNGAAGLEPGEVPIYFGSKEQEILRNLSAGARRTFAEEVRGIVLDALKQRGLVTDTVAESNLIFFGDPVRSVEVKLVGEIAAGEPLYAVPRDEKTQVPDFFMKPGKQYMALRVRGDSMIDDGIQDGSLIICEARTSAENGERVVALIDGDKATVKRLYHEGNHIRLQPSNVAHKPIYIGPGQRLDIQGVVVGIFHKPS